MSKVFSGCCCCFCCFLPTVLERKLYVLFYLTYSLLVFKVPLQVPKFIKEKAFSCATGELYSHTLLQLELIDSLLSLST